ncbi:MAG: 4Fe-4S dicluster domain-containing protein [Ruminococcaceae bacterium]|nr:4Fe-4S dicluster domain-containing protein [Oscillospiraceae bacterium]
MNLILHAVLLFGGIGLLLGIGLGLAAHFMSVKENEKAVAILSELPGANCGACGFSGCAGYAKALAESPGVRNNLCPVGGDAVAEQIAAILGTTAAKTVKKTARVRCRGSEECRVRLADYEGVQTCRAASVLYNGGSGCAFGCTGFGDCVAACEVGAITVREGVAVVDESLCVACGKCKDACPKRLITVTPLTTPTVLCRNPDKGPATKAVCKAGCVGCRLCEKACPAGAVVMENGVARVSRSKCTGCGACVTACRLGVIYLN